jgi:hypothetical protein
MSCQPSLSCHEYFPYRAGTEGKGKKVQKNETINQEVKQQVGKTTFCLDLCAWTFVPDQCLCLFESDLNLRSYTKTAISHFASSKQRPARPGITRMVSRLRVEHWRLEY